MAMKAAISPSSLHAGGPRGIGHSEKTKKTQCTSLPSKQANMRLKKTRNAALAIRQRQTTTIWPKLSSLAKKKKNSGAKNSKRATLLRYLTIRQPQARSNHSILDTTKVISNKVRLTGSETPWISKYSRLRTRVTSITLILNPNRPASNNNQQASRMVFNRNRPVLTNRSSNSHSSNSSSQITSDSRVFNHSRPPLTCRTIHTPSKMISAISSSNNSSGSSLSTPLKQERSIHGPPVNLNKLKRSSPPPPAQTTPSHHPFLVPSPSRQGPHHSTLSQSNERQPKAISNKRPSIPSQITNPRNNKALPPRKKTSTPNTPASTPSSLPGREWTRSATRAICVFRRNIPLPGHSSRTRGRDSINCTRIKPAVGTIPFLANNSRDSRSHSPSSRCRRVPVGLVELSRWAGKVR